MWPCINNDLYMHINDIIFLWDIIKSVLHVVCIDVGIDVCTLHISDLPPAPETNAGAGGAFHKHLSFAFPLESQHFWGGDIL